jgi:Superfamily I DNA and RNA helicases
MQSKSLIRCAAAGSGKTWNICHDVLKTIKTGAHNRILIITYTNNGVDTIKCEYQKQNYGIIDNCVKVYSWFHFLLKEMVKPYQSFITDINEIKSIDFSQSYGRINFNAKGTKKRYLNKNSDIKSNVVSEMVLQLEAKSKGLVFKRLKSIYSHIYIDEIQDMVGDDLEIIKCWIELGINVVCVGDNKQSTYKTHNTIKNKSKSGANVWSFFKGLEKEKLVCIEENNISRRFNSDLCSFANIVYPNGNDITTSMVEVTGHDGVYIILHDNAALYLDYYRPQVLKFDIRTETDGYKSLNFGVCKGMTFERVLIYPNKPFTNFLFGGKLSSPEKYYVAVTRPKYSIAFVVEEFAYTDLFEQVNLKIGNSEIFALKFKTVMI